MRSDQNGNMVQSIDYRTAGIVLSVKPDIYQEFIGLTISQELSSFRNTSTSNIDSPSILKRQSSTVIDAREGEVIVLAGLDETREVQSSEGFAWLPRFLGSSSATKSRSQILLMIEVVRRQ